MNHFRLLYQILVNEDAEIPELSPSSLNMPNQTEYCQFTVTAPSSNIATLNAVNCKIKNLNYLQNQYLSLDRAADGSWQCKASAGIPKAYLPQATKRRSSSKRWLQVNYWLLRFLLKSHYC